jgi:hypothetical protein
MQILQQISCSGQRLVTLLSGLGWKGLMFCPCSTLQLAKGRGDGYSAALQASIELRRLSLTGSAHWQQSLVAGGLSDQYPSEL